MKIKIYSYYHITEIRSAILFCVITLTTFLNNVTAAEVFNSETIHVENRSPVVQLFSLSRPDFTLNKSKNTTQVKSRVELINYISQTNKENEHFFIDGETLVITNTIQHQLSHNTIMHINIPWLKHSEGIADDFIYDFHEAFQFPQNGRTTKNNNQLSWELSKNGNSALSLNDNKSGLGDVQIKLSWSPETSENTQITSQLKLPTGKFKDQTGSEKIDFGMSVIKNNPEWLKRRKWLSASPVSFWYGAGINYLSSISELDDFDAYPIVATLRTGAAWSILPNWAIKAQFDTNSPLFNSDIRELGWMPIQISFATEHKLSNSITFDFVLVEDLRPSASPDVAFSSGLSIKF